MNPKRSLQQRQGTIGAVVFELFINRELQWIYRPVRQENDFGIDGYIDVVESNSVTGAGLAVQIKCGQSYVSKRTKGGIRYDGEIKHLNYYCNSRHPVLLIVFDPSSTVALNFLAQVLISWAARRFTGKNMVPQMWRWC